MATQEALKSITFFSPFFFPEPISTGKYNTFLVARLADEYKVKVVCSAPIYPQWRPEPVLDDYFHPNLSINRGGFHIRYPKNTNLRRAILEAWYALHAIRMSIGQRPVPDAVVAVFPPSLFLLLYRWVFRPKIPIIGIVHDLQGVYAARKSGMSKRVLQGLITWVESRCFQACSRLIFLSHSMQECAIQTYHLNPAKCSVAYPFKTIDESAPLGTNLEHLLPSKHIHVVYAGALGEKQNPDGLITLFNLIHETYPTWRVHIFSSGPIFEKLSQAFASAGFIQFHGLVPEADLPELLQRSSIQIVPQAPGTSEGSLPSKLPNIVALSKQLLCITDPDSELVRLLKDYPPALVTTSWDPSQLRSVIQQLAIQPNHPTSDLSHSFDLSVLLDLIHSEIYS